MIAEHDDYVDTHAHVFEPGLPLAAGARYVPDYAATVEQYLAVLDAAGFRFGVLVQPSFLGTDNRYLLDAVASAPDRLRAVIVVDHTEPRRQLTAPSIAELSSRGVRGVRLNLIGRSLPPLASPGWREAAALMAEHGWHLEIQAEGAQWEALSTEIETWPGAVVIDHLGLPRAQEPAARGVVLALARLDHVHVKVSAPYRSPEGEAESMLGALLREGLRDRLLFGSDWPHTRHESASFTAVESWCRAHLAEADAVRVFAANAHRLLGTV